MGMENYSCPHSTVRVGANSIEFWGIAGFRPAECRFSSTLHSVEKGTHFQLSEILAGMHPGSRVTKVEDASCSQCKKVNCTVSHQQRSALQLPPGIYNGTRGLVSCNSLYFTGSNWRLTSPRNSLSHGAWLLCSARWEPSVRCHFGNVNFTPIVEKLHLGSSW